MPILDGLVIGAGHDQVAGRSPIANVAALRALTSAFVANYVDLAGYSTAFDGGGGLIGYDASDTTSADNAATVFVDASNRRWKRILNGQLLTFPQAGAKTDGSDNTAIVEAASALVGPLHVPTGEFFFSQPLILPPDGTLIGDAYSGSKITFGSAGFVQLNGFDIILEKLQISGTEPDATIYAAGLNLQRCHIRDNLIFNFSGNCIAIASQITNLEITGNNILGTKFGILLNNSSNAGDTLRIINNTILVGFDCIEVNSPGTGFMKWVTVTGNICTSQASFAFGWAAARQGTITGNYFSGAIAAVHLEDALSDVTVANNILTGALDGLWLNQGPNAIPGGPVVATGNVIRSSATPGTSGTGIINNNNSFGTNPRCIFTNNKIHDYSVGIHLNGFGTHVVDGNSIEGCPVGIQTDGAASPGTPLIISGTNVMKGVTTAALLAGSTICGKIIFDDAVPQTAASKAILTKAGSGSPGPILRGFAGPIPSITISGAGAHSVIGFPLPSRMYGSLKWYIGNGGSTNSCFRSAIVKWDGTTFTETLTNDADLGAFTGAPSTASGGNCMINFSTSGALSGYSIYVDFDGDYYQA